MKIQFHENVRFCPKCGVDSLERDYHRQALPKLGGGGEKGTSQTDGTEWICLTCGLGFKIKKSTRWHLAEELFRSERKRSPVKFNVECVGQEIADEYERTREDHL